ncbi:MAG: metal-dependent hydrolase [Chloroflexi bacterium]|nr:metal-dependent hydrolase [Chloroflexota bacterium]
MILPGHIALAVLAAQVTGVDLRASLAASMAPDLVDKPTRWLLRLTPNDRIPAHTFLFWAASSLLARALLGPRFARGWAVGYGIHLVADHVNSYLNPGRIYPWWPFRRYQMHTGPTGIKSSLNDFSPASLAIEGAAVVAATLAWGIAHRRRQRRGDNKY